MTAAEHPSVTLRRASARLREAMAPATPPPWSVAFIDGEIPAIDGPGLPGLVAEMQQRTARAMGDAALAVLLRNAAEGIAGWLEAEAEHAERFTATDPYGRSRWCQQCAGTLGRDCACWDAALATARAILGEEDSAATAAGQED